MVATCTKCFVSKPKSEFFRRTDRPKGITSKCKICRTKEHKLLYNRQRNAVYAVNRNRRNKIELVNHFNNKCLDCGLSFPVCVYDFHHLDPKQKEGRQALTTKRRERIVQEKENCVMLCANCHRIRHWKAPIKPEQQEQEPVVKQSS